MDYNSAMLIGRLVRDPDIRTTPSGVKCAQFTLAAGKRWKDRSGNVQESTQFIPVVVWRGGADVVEQYCHKGSRVFVEGEIQVRSYDGKDGVKRWVTEVVANRIGLLDTKKSDGQTQKTAQKPQGEKLYSRKNQKPQNDAADVYPDDDFPLDFSEMTSGNVEIPF